MDTFLRNPLFSIKREAYLSLLIIIGPLLNFLSGITFDLHAPSLPAIATYFSTSPTAAKNTIAITILGFAVGCVVFGTLLEVFGRRKILLLALLLYTLVSFAALSCTSINQLLLIRFSQGFAVSCAAIGCRTILFDSFSGHELKIAMLYSSLAFGIGQVIAPFFGGLLQDHFGWRACFIVYGLVSSALMLMVTCYIAESKPETEKFSFSSIWIKYRRVVTHKVFLVCVIICALSQIQILVYTIAGAFIVETTLHYSAIVYGKSALIVSSGYLFGSLVNRVLIRRFTVYQLLFMGFIIAMTGVLFFIIFAISGSLNLFTLVGPLTIIIFGQGFIYTNIFTHCLSLSPNAGIAIALFITSTMTLSTFGTAFLSHFHATNLMSIAILFAILSLAELLVFLVFSRRLQVK